MGLVFFWGNVCLVFYAGTDDLLHLLKDVVIIFIHDVFWVKADHGVQVSCMSLAYLKQSRGVFEADSWYEYLFYSCILGSLDDFFKVFGKF